MTREPPEDGNCTKCGADIEVRRDIGVWEWNWTCHECNYGDAQLKKEHRHGGGRA